jgi:L-ascorbate metabolism protein UlaG (beta-lactamase superfamily)
MKIKNLGWSSFQLSTGDITVMTDPLALSESGLSFRKNSADVVLFSEKELLGKEKLLSKKELKEKVVPEHRKEIIEISSPGEYEIGGVMIRRDVNSYFYTIDEAVLRVVYMGLIDDSLDVSSTKDLGDVDVLILPVGNGDLFLSYDKIEKILNYIDPTILLPCGYKQEGLKLGENLKSKEDFIKHFGFRNVREESYLNVTPSPEQENKNIEVIFLN